MQRDIATFVITDFSTIKQQLLHWANQYNSCSFLDNHQYPSLHNSVECLVGVGAVKTFSPTANHQQQLKKNLHDTNDWLFGHISYDYKNILHTTTIAKTIDTIGFEPIYFFQPEIVLQLSKTELRIESLTKKPAIIFEEISVVYDVRGTMYELENTMYDVGSTMYDVVETRDKKQETNNQELAIKARISKASYVQIIEQLKTHILRGDCYEINFCQEFYAEHAVINPLHIYQQLTQLSPNPFASYYKLNDKYLLCASPERYLKKENSKLISQPIKGTFKRNKIDKNIDETLKQQLFESEKDRSENVMVVDLVRNDLSKICKQGSVNVEELFGIYTFPQVHQMISTITGELQDGLDFADILQATFPMGSMTGAPKTRVMQLIAEYEQSRRGLYSGSVGYITRDKNFDFNVVIRSILYNASNHYLSYHVGSGITFNSDAESEYEECLLKAEAMIKVLTENEGLEH